MTPEEMSAEVAMVVKEAQNRVGPNSIGAQQYWKPGEPQKFETVNLDDLLEYCLEEALDIINYGMMLSVRFRRLQAFIRESGMDRKAFPEEE